MYTDGFCWRQMYALNMCILCTKQGENERFCISKCTVVHFSFVKKVSLAQSDLRKSFHEEEKLFQLENEH